MHKQSKKWSGVQYPLKDHDHACVTLLTLYHHHVIKLLKNKTGHSRAHMYVLSTNTVFLFLFLFPCTHPKQIFVVSKSDKQKNKNKKQKQKQTKKSPEVLLTFVFIQFLFSQFYVFLPSILSFPPPLLQFPCFSSPFSPFSCPSFPFLIFFLSPSLFLLSPSFKNFPKKLSKGGQLAHLAHVL